MSLLAPCGVALVSKCYSGTVVHVFPPFSSDRQDHQLLGYNSWEEEGGNAETAHYTVPDWQCLHSGFGHGVRAQQDVLKAAHSGILCCLPH